jgi:deoxycytidine triphosphate deaminase
MVDDTFRGMWEGEEGELRPAALLADWQVRRAIETHGLLVDPETVSDLDAAKYASLEVHAAPEVGRTDYPEDGSLEEHKKATPNGDISIPAGDTVRLFTVEHFLLPADVFATVTGLGQLYAAGLTVGSTYVDPGTRHQIYLSVSNVSDRTVVIPAGAPIGRAQFFILGESARKLKRDSWRTDLGYRSIEEHDSALARDEVPAPETSHTDVSAEVRDLRRRNHLDRIALVVIASVLVAMNIPERTFDWLDGKGLPPRVGFLVTAVAAGAFFELLLAFIRYVLKYWRDEPGSNESSR